MKPVELSVVMSACNAELYIEEAIKSILYQSLECFEFIIINDGSTDGTQRIIKSFSDNRIVYINQTNTGLAKSLNRGIAAAKTNIIARMDADDVAEPTRLEKQFDFLTRDNRYVAVGSNASIIDKDGRFVFFSNQPITNEECKSRLPETPFFHPAVMFRKESFYKAGQYCESMVKAQDVVLFNRMAQFGWFYNLAEPLLKYRIVPTANSLRSRKSSKRLTVIINHAIQENNITKTDAKYLKSLLENRNTNARFANYHLYLAKKYLWNNFEPTTARKHLFEALTKKLNIHYCFYLLASFLPEKTIKKLYQTLK